MKNIEKVALPVALLAIIGLGVWSYNDMSDRQQQQYAEGRCWVKGGTYTDGRCDIPEDLRTPQQKVCEAMEGNFVIAEDKVTREKEYWCYSDQGKELKLPNLENKEVVVMDDGTVTLRKKN